MLKKEYLSKNATMTKDLANKIGEKLWDGSCVLLSGELGAGKTCFTQGLARGLQIKRNITSPTFTIFKIYQDGRLPLFHIDAYRLENNFQDVGFSDYIGVNGVSAIEWPDYISQLLPAEYLKVTFNYVDEDIRLLKLEAQGESYCDLLEEVLC